MGMVLEQFHLNMNRLFSNRMFMPVEMQSDWSLLGAELDVESADAVEKGCFSRPGETRLGSCLMFSQCTTTP